MLSHSHYVTAQWEHCTMFNVYRNLRAMSTQQSTSLNIHRSGWKVKLQGTLDTADDAGAEALVAKQPTDAAGRIDTKATGKLETESHTASVSFAYPLKAELLATVQGHEVKPSITTPKAGDSGAIADAKAHAAEMHAEDTPKAKPTKPGKKAKGVPEAEEVVIDRGTDTSALNGEAHTNGQPVEASK